MSVTCPVCDAVASTLYREVDGYDYFECASCGSIHIDERVLAAIDAGEQTRVYDEGYWAAELRAAEERS